MFLICEFQFRGLGKKESDMGRKEKKRSAQAPSRRRACDRACPRAREAESRERSPRPRGKVYIYPYSTSVSSTLPSSICLPRFPSPRICLAPSKHRHQQELSCMNNCLSKYPVSCQSSPPYNATAYQLQTTNMALWFSFGSKLYCFLNDNVNS